MNDTPNAPTRELDRRTTSGIDVRLIWNSDTDEVTVAVHDTLTGELFELAWHLPMRCSRSATHMRTRAFRGPPACSPFEVGVAPSCFCFFPSPSRSGLPETVERHGGRARCEPPPERARRRYARSSDLGGVLPGALAYLLCDIAVLWVSIYALGYEVPVAP